MTDDLAMTDVDRMVAEHYIDMLIYAGERVVDAVNNVEGLDKLEMDTLTEALARIKGHPDGTRGFVAYLQVIQRDIEQEITGRMSTKWVPAADVMIERSPANVWRVDPHRVVMPLAEKIMDGLDYGDDPSVRAVVATTIRTIIECLGASEEKWSTTRLRALLEMPKPTKANGLDDDAFETVADQIEGPMKLTLHRPDADTIPKKMRSADGNET